MQKPIVPDPVRSSQKRTLRGRRLRVVYTYITLVLAGVLILSSLSKFASRKAFHKTLFEIGLKSRQIIVIGWLVPALELISGALLLIPPLQTVGQAATLLLFILFAAVVGRTVLRKKAPDCNCFGSLLPEKMGVSTLIRLAVLMALTLYLLLTETVALDAVPARQLVYQAFTSIGLILAYILFASMLKSSFTKQTR